jgi:glutamate-ammonia-ligase adenylyltransferase
VNTKSFKESLQQVSFSELLEQVKSCSPWLEWLLKHHVEFLAQLVEETPENTLTQICSRAASAAYAEDRAAAAKILREEKNKLALFVGLCDVGGVWRDGKVTAALTRFADVAVASAVDVLLREEQTKGRLVLVDKDRPSLGCGYVVLAMGKMGAFELNYSSDIDLIILYDPDTAPLVEGIEASMFFVKLTRSLVSVLQDVTEDGYVFRTDLRLRPDPRATQVAIAIEAAAIYYEYQGQNWERAAMIKARPCAGDIALGTEFLQRLTPYIWRKYLDYAAIADVQSMKRQIHAVKGHGEIAVRGHDLKLGRGGIREIEFFVQTQQLIAGGRNPKLRARSTIAMLDGLAAEGWISAETAKDMEGDYWFLRMLEHRAQMIDDLQTHHVPKDEIKFESFARFAGFADGASLAVKLEQTLRRVQNHYAALFEQASDLGASEGSLVFTGADDDPATLETLAKLGFTNGPEIAATIRAWHFGRYAAMRTARAREVLTEIMPRLLKSLSSNGQADQAFWAFDKFLKNLPAGVQLFSMIKANPRLVDLLALIMGTAPRLAEKLSHRPRILEAVIAPDFFGPLPDANRIKADLDLVLPDDTPRDEAMDRLRVWAREMNFRFGLRLLSETISADEAGRGFSDIAGAAIDKLLHVVLREMEQSHGRVEGGACLVLGLGKLGGGEMTAGSDLDIMLVYDHGQAVEESDGEKPLSPLQYYTRVTQRLVTGLTVLTSEGELYEVDMRLRPSGSKGPLAVSRAAFETYQKTDAWTWERMALTRARVVAGDGDLGQKIETIIAETLCQKRDPGEILADVAKMRALMIQEHTESNLWDLKRKPGGQVDIEFIAQYLQLVHAWENPDILQSNTFQAIVKLQENGFLEKPTARALLGAITLYQSITQFLRLCVDGSFEPQSAPTRLNGALSRLAGQPNMAAAEAVLADQQTAIAAIFTQLIGRDGIQQHQPSGEH